MRERVDLKSPVREYRPPGSVRGAPGNRCPYLDIFDSGVGNFCRKRAQRKQKKFNWEKAGKGGEKREKVGKEDS